MLNTDKRLTVSKIRAKKGVEPIVAVTCYDYSFATLVDPIVDLVLVGDSMGMVIQGGTDTLSVTLEDVIYHTRAVRRGLTQAHLVADLPFMSYQESPEQALRSAGKLLSVGGAQAVKLEGGVQFAHTVERLVSSGIPVVGHIGLTPQSVHAFGGYKIQGKTETARGSILEDARALEDSGAYCIVLEGIPTELAEEITTTVKIPTIGIGAGNVCDGQILVLQDLLGMQQELNLKFVKRFANLSETVAQAVSQYRDEVKKRTFPDRAHSFYVDS